MYRSRESERVGYPVVWINKTFWEEEGDISDEGELFHELLLSIAHEYGHAVYRFSFSDIASEDFIGAVGKWEDQEEFAEDFGKYVSGHWDASLVDKKAINKIMDMYGREAFYAVQD